MREGFFTSPTKERRKGERPQISHIIRGGESRGENRDKRPDPAGFTPFGQTAPSEPGRNGDHSREYEPDGHAHDRDVREAEPRGFAPGAATDRTVADKTAAVRTAAVKSAVPASAGDREPRSPYDGLRRLEERRMEAEQRRETAERYVPRPFEASGDDRNAFRPFGAPEPESYAASRGETFRGEAQRGEAFRGEAQRGETFRGEAQRGEAQRGETFRGETQRGETFRGAAPYSEEPRRERIKRSERPLVGEFVDYTGELDVPRGPRMAPRSEPTFTEEYDDREYKAAAEPVSQPEQLEPPPPKPRVIRKNAAAISAYGKMSGAAVSAAPPEMNVVSEPPTLDLTDIAPREPVREPVREAPQISRSRDGSRSDRNRDANRLDDDPFKDIESIFDVLEQSEDELSQRPRRSRGRREEERDTERETERGAERGESLPRRVTKENAPSGIWTDDRDVYGESADAPAEQSELDMLKEKKHGRSNKTKRLYDAIMRDPENNPNFRR